MGSPGVRLVTVIPGNVKVAETKTSLPNVRVAGLSAVKRFPLTSHVGVFVKVSGSAEQLFPIA